MSFTVDSAIVHEYLVRKVASLICQHTQKNIPDSSGKIDWAIAEAWIKHHNPWIENNIGMNLAQNTNLTSFSYEDFEKAYGHYVWEYIYQPLQVTLPHLYRINKY
jgi:hypothetical protein